MFGLSEWGIDLLDWLALGFILGRAFWEVGLDLIVDDWDHDQALGSLEVTVLYWWLHSVLSRPLRCGLLVGELLLAVDLPFQLVYGGFPGPCLGCLCHRFALNRAHQLLIFI